MTLREAWIQMKIEQGWTKEEALERAALIAAMDVEAAKEMDGNIPPGLEREAIRLHRELEECVPKRQFERMAAIAIELDEMTKT